MIRWTSRRSSAATSRTSCRAPSHWSGVRRRGRRVLGVARARGAAQGVDRGPSAGRHRARAPIELLAYQFASPVRWIETQELLFDPAALGIERIVEVGLGSQPTVANMARYSRSLIGGLAEHVDVFNAEADAEAVNYADADPAVEAPAPEPGPLRRRRRRPRAAPAAPAPAPAAPAATTRRHPPTRPAACSTRCARCSPIRRSCGPSRSRRPRRSTSSSTAPRRAVTRR